jgi:hypothetical protein
VPGDAGDLFCFGDEDAGDWEDDVKEEAKKAGIGALTVDGGAGPTATLNTATATATMGKNIAKPTLVEADDD